jgi:transcriptional regulator with XRE-family HTH domain
MVNGLGNSSLFLCHSAIVVAVHSRFKQLSMNNTHTTTFQKWLQKAMDNMEWGQADLANKAGLNRQVIHGWLKQGKVPDIESLGKVAAAFDIDVETIYKKAGIKLSKPQIFDENVQKILNVIEDLSERDKEEVFEFVQMLKKLRTRQNQ